MARQIITSLIDDIDGSEADETVRFGLDGVAYEIDLSSANALNFREALALYVARGTRASSGRVLTPGGRGAGAAVTAGRRAENQKIREWAHSMGWPVTDRGRIAVEIQEAFRNNTPGPNYSGTKSDAAATARSGGASGGEVANTSGGANAPETLVDETEGGESATDTPATPETVSDVSGAVFSEAVEAPKPRKRAPRKAPASPFSGEALASAIADGETTTPVKRTRKAATK